MDRLYYDRRGRYRRKPFVAPALARAVQRIESANGSDKSKRQAMKLNETRYKGVWASGYNEAMNQANEVIRHFVSNGGQFSTDVGRAWTTGSLALKLGNRIAEPPRDGIIVAMDILNRSEHTVR